VTAPDGNAVRRSVAALRTLLDRVPDGDAAVPVMGTSVTAVAQHLVSCLAWYAHDLAAGDAETSPADLVPRPDAVLATVARSIGAWGEVLARTVDVPDPMTGLLWATGRADLPGRAFPTSWTYATTPADPSA
jgi:hypothetical protein